MKKILFFLSLILCLASCSEDPIVDKPAESGKLKLEFSELTLNQQQSSKPQTIKLLGVTGDVVATVDPAASEWCKVAASLNDAKSSDDWILTVTVEDYTGNSDRKAYITVTSGIDQAQLIIIQSGRANKTRMVVVNEGQFTKGTAALSSILYDGTSNFDIFRQVNNRPLGDVAQSMEYINGNYFVVLNNSQKIEVVEPETFKSVATISYKSPGKPRFIQPINDSVAIVSDLNSQIVKINTKSFNIIEHIGLDFAIEKMTGTSDKLFCNASGKLVVFDKKNVAAQAHRRIDGIKGGIIKTAKMILDKNGKLWVLTTEYTQMNLICIDTKTEKVERTVTIPYAKKGTDAYINGAITGTSSYTRMDTDRTNGKLYFYASFLIDTEKGTTLPGIFTLDVNKDAIDSTPYRELAGLGMMYGMSISPDGDVFLCDCLDYSAQRGFVREYKADGSVDSKRVGIYPRMIHFTEYDR